jgi:N-acetyl-1-D-myo-inositol-2-amino-2-deoxy-alpha-D-glucopyranoside deacetylase
VLEAVNANQLTGDIVAFIRRTRPTVIITFGPEGAPTGHRDHRAISRAATAAYFLSGLKTAFPDQALEPWSASRLFYHAWEPPAPDAKMPLESVPFTCSVDVRDHRATKDAAFRAHGTQQGSSWAFYELALKDAEQLALAAGTPQPRATIEDVFDGLE